MKGITVCCDGDEKLEKELSLLSSKTKKNSNLKNKLKIQFDKLFISNLKIVRR